MALQGGNIEMSSKPILSEAEVSSPAVCAEASGDAPAPEPTEAVAASEEPAVEMPSDAAPDSNAVEQPSDAALEESAVEQPLDAAPEAGAEPAEPDAEAEGALAEQPSDAAPALAQVSRGLNCTLLLAPGPAWYLSVFSIPKSPKAMAHDMLGLACCAVPETF